MATPDGVHGKVPYRDLSKNLTEMDSAARLVSPVCSDRTRTFPNVQCAGFSVFCHKSCPVRQHGAFVSRRVDPAICSASAVTDRLIRRGEPHNFRLATTGRVASKPSLHPLACPGQHAGSQIPVNPLACGFQRKMDLTHC